ncbi:MAG: S49 family peptidase [Dysgonamonadaceae bacterium]|jgi:protease-4|nr:S49 family peptidase [Dysgonamonadaceae bacterium]
MLKHEFLQEIRKSVFGLDSSGWDTIDSIANAIYLGTFAPESIESFILSTRGEVLHLPEEDSDENPFDRWQYDSIAVIPLFGIMFKRSYWWSYGMDDIAKIIRLAYNSEKIAAVIIDADTPGGSTDSLYLLQEVLSEKIKPTFGYINGMCASCGYVALSYTDRLYAINRMASVGGVGVYARMVVPNKENAPYKIVEVYPKESKDKNIEVREAIKGNTAPLEEELSKLALYIQQTVKGNRPAISEDTMSGKLYYGYEAESLGMIDGIRKFTDIVMELETLVEKRKQFLSTI